jgi:hypothetical protein
MLPEPQALDDDTKFLRLERLGKLESFNIVTEFVNGRKPPAHSK